MSLNTTAASVPKECDLLIRADAAVTQDENRRVVHDACVIVTDGIIVEVGDYKTLDARYSPTNRLDMSGKVLLPGLVNAHTHLPMTLLRGVADDLPLMEWLEKHIWPIEFQLNEELLAVGARLGCAEFIRTGCTAFLNGYFHEHITGDVAQASGLRAVLGEGFFNFPSPFFPTAEDCWRTVKNLKDRFKESHLIRTAVTPHAVFTVDPDYLVASYELAVSLGIPWQTHLAESEAETAICLEKYGKRPVMVLYENGILSDRTTVHHCVDVTDEEIEILAATGTNVVHNPASNLKLCSGISPVQKMLDAGVNVGLGTDGASSNNQLNMFRDMGLAALIGKIGHKDASAVAAQTALDMATVNSAKCLGWPELGRIAPGRPADLIALDMSSPNLMPAHNLVSHVVYAATGMEVCMTMVAGEILYLYGEFKTMDMNTLKMEAKSAARWVRSKAKK